MTHVDVDPTRRNMVTVAVIMATILTAIASTIANVVLPQIRGSTGAAQTQIGWVLTSFILAGVIVTPALGWLESVLGRRRLLLIALAGFGGASILCGLAHGIYDLVLYRLVQGAFAAVFVPVSQAILLDINPPERHGRAMSVWGMGAVLGPIVGPVLGGWLSEHFSWQWVFFMNIPVVVMAFFMVSNALPKDAPRTPLRFDAFGFAAIALGMIGFQLLLDRGPSQEWFASPEVCIEAGMAALGIYIFFVHTFTTQHAIFNRRIWADRNFLTAVVMIVFIGILMFAGMAVLPTMLQTLLGYPVLHAGFVQLPRGVGTLISMFLVGRLVGRVDSRLIVLVGIGLTALSYYIMSLFSLEMDERLVVYSGLVQGLGLGLIFVPLSTLAFRTIAPHLRTEAASLFTLTRNIGSSIGISLVGALQIVNTKTVQEQLVEHVTPENPVASGAVNFDSTQALAQLNAAIVRQATMVAYIDSFHMLFLMCLAIAPLILFMNVKSKSPAHA